jgi:hypothetical protein
VGGLLRQAAVLHLVVVEIEVDTATLTTMPHIVWIYLL